MEPISAGHAIVLVIHLLLFVYWLGGDLGVFYSSRFVVNPSLTREARMTAAKIMLDIDLIPRICLSLMLTVGGILTEFYGVVHPPLQMAAIVLLGPSWLGMVLFIHFREGTAAGHRVQRFDFWFRWFMIAAICASVAYSIATDRLTANPWIAAKLLIFAFLIFCGLMIRLGMPPFVAAFRNLAAKGASDADNAQLRQSLAKVRPWVFAIWAGVLLEAVIGVLKPGAG
jgi:hypothetical protein